MMGNRRSFAVAVLGAVGAFLLAGCSGQKGPSGTPAGGAQQIFDAAVHGSAAAPAPAEDPAGDPPDIGSGSEAGSAQPGVMSRDAGGAVAIDAEAGDGSTLVAPPSDAGVEPDGGTKACSAGFDRDSTSGECVDIDECSIEHGGCHVHAMCTDNSVPAAPPTCACPADYIGDGTHCDLRFRAVRVGSEHVCGLARDGSLYCWGNNRRGQLGTGNIQFGPESSRPTRVGSDSDWTDLAVGEQRTCATRAGALYCWGDNTSGALGLGADASGERHWVPAALAGDDWFGLSSAGGSSCALRGNAGSGQLYCFGLLVGSKVTAPEPVLVGDASMRWQAISMGSSHACAIRDDGALFCWGDHNYSGQLGLGMAAVGSAAVPTPTRVGTSSDWSAVDIGAESTCAVRESGELWCWGEGWYLPNRTSGILPAPVRQGVWDDWTTVSVDEQGGTGCGLRGEGTVWCWGSNDLGQAGQPPTNWREHLTLAQVGSDSDWASVSVGGTTVCGVRADRVHCWGSNGAGKLGIADVMRATIVNPARVGTGNDWSAVSAGRGATCGIRSGQLYCWGWRSDTNLYVPTPARVGNDGNWTDVTTDYLGASMGLRGGQIYHWGTFDVLQPTLEPASYGWSSVAQARDIWPQSWSAVPRCALRGDELWCWGENEQGQLGVGDRIDRFDVAQVAGSWKAVSMAMVHTCAISSTEELYCWGSKGRLGTNAPDDALAPVRVGNEAGWTSVSAGDFASCGVRAGALYCWEAAPPAQVTRSTNWSAVSVYRGSHCAISGPALYCWGNNADGQLGMGGLSSSTAPGLLDEGDVLSWQTVSVGARHSCAIRGDGSLWCWGENGVGETGIEPSWTHVPTPADLD